MISKKNLEFLFLIIFSVFFSFLALNFLLFFFSKNFIKQEIIPKNLLRYLPIETTYFYTNTYEALKTYDVILGDSHVFGSGDAYLNDEYDYTIAHHLYNNLGKNVNILNIGVPGAGSATIFENFEKSQRKIKFKPNKVIFFFYEGNDLENNMRFLKSSKKDKFEKNIIYYFPLLKIVANILFVLFPDYLTENTKIDYSLDKDLKNKYFLKGKYITSSNRLESPPIDFNQEQLYKSMNVLFESIVKLKSYSDNISLIYLPAQTTILDLKDPIYIEKDFGKNNSTKYFKKELDSLSNNIKENIIDFSETNKIQFIDMTDLLKKHSYKKNIYGTFDYKHLNKYSHKLIAEDLMAKIYKKN